MKNSLQIAPGRPDAWRAKASFGETWRWHAPEAESAIPLLVQITSDLGGIRSQGGLFGWTVNPRRGGTPGVLDPQGMAELKGRDERPKKIRRWRNWDQP